ncbi:hypothetical protein FB451DRAFT_1534526 [Mycena latifolia]|nr:hypothetical protein FB451DRAFT_1534526 [Mycena latifolia]
MSFDSDVCVPLSPDDSYLLYRFGRAVAQDAVGLIWETLFLSAYGIFFCLSIWTIFRRGLKSISSIIMLLVVVYLYASSLALWGLNMTLWFKRVHALFMDYPNLGLADRLDAGNVNVEILGSPMESLFMFNMIVGDSVVIWRVWVLYLTPGSLGHMRSGSDAPNVLHQTAIANGGPVCERAELISWAFSFVTNAACTILIGYKAWQHRGATKALNISVTSRRISTNRILSLLVESGFIYCLFWLTQLILFFDVSRDTPLIYVYQLFAGMGDQISGMYPTLIIVIVNLHQTIWDESSHGETKNSNLRFASGRTEQTAPFHSIQGAKIHLDTEITSTGAISMGKIGDTSYVQNGEV